MNANHSLTFALALTAALTAGPALAQPVGPGPVGPGPVGPGPVGPGPVGPAPGLMGPMESMTLKMLAAQDVTISGDFALLSPLSMMFGQDRERTAEERQKEREAAERDRERERENRIYEEALRARDDSKYDRAIERFGDVVSMKGSKADAALYWKAYSQDRAGQRAEALTSVQSLIKEYPSSRYLQQARVLEAEIRRNAGQPARPQDQGDEEMKLMALNAIMESSPEQAIPVVEKILNGTSSPKLKERALFVLAQSNSPQALTVLKGIAKGNSTPELQSRAINYLGTQGGRESRAVLSEVYSSSNDIDTKKRILRAFMVSGEKDRLMAAAQSEQNAELRATAVQQLGVMGAHSELSTLYQKESSVDVKKQIIQAMFVGGNTTRMIELAKTERDPDLRRTAIRNLGLMGARPTADALVDIYNSDKDASVRRAVIQALALSDNAAQLVAIARKEEDPTLKKEIISRLSHMNSKIATDYMLEILNK